MKLLTENKPGTLRKVTVSERPKKVGCMYVPPEPNAVRAPAGPKKNC